MPKSLSLEDFCNQYSTETVICIAKEGYKNRKGRFTCLVCDRIWTNKISRIRKIGVYCFSCKVKDRQQKKEEKYEYQQDNFDIVVCSSPKPDKEYIKRRAKQYAAVKYKGGHCEDCQLDLLENFWAANFHHKDPNTKDFTIGELYCKQWHYLKKEFDKCSLLCNNCHHKKHFDLVRYGENKDIIRSLGEDILEFEKSDISQPNIKTDRYSIERVKIKTECLDGEISAGSVSDETEAFCDSRKE